MFEWLFNFKPVQFAEGEIGFQAGAAAGLFAVVAVVLVVGFVVVYSVTRVYTSNRSRAVSLGLRIPALLLLCLPLFEPVLITPDVVPDENFIAVLVDASASMAIPDGVLGTTRADDARHVLLDPETGIIPAVSEHFKVRYYRFSDQARRTDSLRQAPPEGRATDLTAALERVLDDFKGVPLSGVVLLTDGGDNGAAVPRNKAEELRSLDIPLHIVGVGQETFAAEREVLEVSASKGVEETTGAEIDVKVRSWVDETGPVRFNLYRGSEVVLSEVRSLKGGGKIDQFALFYEPETPGAFAYRLEVAPTQGEQNTANNTLDLLIDTRRDTLRVLYLEGQPRAEYKFIKRALEDDQVVEVASVLRTGTGKFYRQGLASPGQLQGGFAADAEELFQYRAVLLGDFEAAAFTPAQLQLLEQFVRVRGGGFLMLGGRNTFAEGGYWDTPVADLLPVTLDLTRRSPIPPDFSRPADVQADRAEQGFRFTPTPAGYDHPVLKLSPDRAVNQGRWASMPGLMSLNYLGATKPGALVLAEKPDDDFGPAEPLLAIQRYGKGRSAALATAGTARWQMLVEADDARHERFWRQLVRWLAAEAPRRVNLDLGQPAVAPGDELAMRVDVYAADYAPMEGVVVEGLLTRPDGGTHNIRFQEDLTTSGTYTGTLVPTAEGIYSLEVVARHAGSTLGRHTQHFLARPSKREFFDATLKRPLLETLATTSGGVYYEPTEVADLPVNLRARRTSTSVYHAAYLWDTPLLFALVLLLLSADWVYRRRRGLA